MLLVVRLLTGLSTLVVKNPLHCLAVIGAVGCNGRFRRRGSGWLTFCSFTVFSSLFLSARLAILGLTIPGSLSIVPRSLLAVLPTLLAVSRPFLAAVGHAGLTAIGRLATRLLLVASSLSTALTIGCIAGGLPGRLPS